MKGPDIWYNRPLSETRTRPIVELFPLTALWTLGEVILGASGIKYSGPGSPPTSYNLLAWTLHNAPVNEAFSFVGIFNRTLSKNDIIVETTVVCLDGICFGRQLNVILQYGNQRTGCPEHNVAPYNPQLKPQQFTNTGLGVTFFRYVGSFGVFSLGLNVIRGPNGTNTPVKIVSGTIWIHHDNCEYRLNTWTLKYLSTPRQTDVIERLLVR